MEDINIDENIEHLRQYGVYQPPSNLPEWIPATDTSPPFTVRLIPPRPGAEPNPCEWEVKSYDAWATIVGSEGFSTGVHYWESKWVKHHDVMFGLLFPPDTSHFDTMALWSHLGHTAKPLLGKYSKAFRLRANLQEYAHDSDRGPELELGATNHDGARTGFMLDMVKLEFTLYYFSGRNATRTPNCSYLLSTLKKGVKYYPAFSYGNTNIVMELHVSAAPPENLERYVAQIQVLTALVRDYRQALDEMRARNHVHDADYAELLRRFNDMTRVLNMQA